jgi:rubrerythrin
LKNLAEKLEVIELLAKHEEALAGLYETYAELFPDCSTWSYLYGEEIKHSEWVRSILNNVYEGSISFTDYHFSEKTLIISIKNLQKLKVEAHDDKFDLEKALDIAFNLERSIIEDHYLDYFQSKLPGIQKVLDDLKEDTQSHRELLKEKREEAIAERISRS